MGRKTGRGSIAGAHCAGGHAGNGKPAAPAGFARRLSRSFWKPTPADGRQRSTKTGRSFALGAHCRGGTKTGLCGRPAAQTSCGAPERGHAAFGGDGAIPNLRWAATAWRNASGEDTRPPREGRAAGASGTFCGFGFCNFCRRLRELRNCSWIRAAASRRAGRWFARTSKRQTSLPSASCWFAPNRRGAQAGAGCCSANGPRFRPRATRKERIIILAAALRARSSACPLASEHGIIAGECWSAAGGVLDGARGRCACGGRA